MAAIGLALVVGTVGFLLYRAFAVVDSPPIVAVQVDSVRAVGDAYLVRFTVTNRGEQTAAALTVQGELVSAAGILETSSATISYVPGHSRRQGGLYFTVDPGQFDLRLRATGYEQP